jgi:gluconokinase
MRVLVMGVAGSGKTTLARSLADRLGWPMVEADDFHDAPARARMAAGIGLDDAGRAPWLARVASAAEQHPNCILACSALKKTYRSILGADCILYLAIGEDEARTRLAGRIGHFAGPALAAGQFAALEEPDIEEGAVWLDATLPPERLLATAQAALAAPGAS